MKKASDITRELAAAYPFLAQLHIDQARAVNFTVFCCPPPSLIHPLQRFDRRFSCHSLIYRHESNMPSEGDTQFCRAFSAACLSAEGLTQLRKLEKRLSMGEVLVAYSRPLKRIGPNENGLCDLQPPKLRRKELLIRLSADVSLRNSRRGRTRLPCGKRVSPSARA